MDQTNIVMSLSEVSDASFTWTIPKYSIEKDYSQIFEWSGITMTIGLKRGVLGHSKFTRFTSHHQYPTLCFKGVPPKSAFKILMTTKAEGVAFFMDYTAITEGATIDGTKQRFLNSSIIHFCYEVDGSLKIYIDVTIKEQKADDLSAKLVSNMRHLLTDDKLADFAFIVEETELPVHKTILSVHIPSFNEILEKAGEENKLKITSAPLDAFKELLHFIYTGEDRNLLRFAKELLVVINRFKLETLKQRCEGRLVAELDCQNLGEIYNLAVRAESMTLKEEIVRMTTSKLHSMAGKLQNKQIPSNDSVKAETFYRKFSELCTEAGLKTDNGTPKKRFAKKNRNQKSTPPGRESNRDRMNSVENGRIKADIKTTKYVNDQVVTEMNSEDVQAAHDGEGINAQLNEKAAVDGQKLAIVDDNPAAEDKLEIEASAAGNAATSADLEPMATKPAQKTITNGKPAHAEENPIAVDVNGSGDKPYGPYEGIYDAFGATASYPTSDVKDEDEQPTTNQKLIKFREFLENEGAISD